ncbi:Multidrug resistance protein MdtA [Pseudoalteromonas holothuriae]|uniref:Multidrug resistance protein MdtA n=1 Tax=Pseudoalteromonas holothuriae TaxID=2963714 RepID=A0A9W4VUM4_9GAMM|nr:MULTISPECIES: efflux RND transporter periplasmic adaptor subunit [unclassified Pseudoalteromonas]CAH9049423.1 Multidrug resistance protein MdtA [Pseudoalteromonas sp. CIP111854]CAH9055988.1 Multidrug resistance protein MdtA [Pseudoalteromonas sp. CIP111951]
MNTSRLNYLIALLISLLCALMPIFCRASSVPLVKVKPVQAWSSGLEYTLNCNVSIPFATKLSSDVEAKITFILPAGSLVKRGELIASQDKTYLDFQHQQLQKTRQIEKLTMEHATQEFARLSKLNKEHVSASQLNLLALQRDTAKLNYLSLDYQIQELKQRLDNLKHFAPTDGYVLSTLADPGEFIANGAPIAEFISQRDKELTCELPHSLLSKQNPLAHSEFLLPSGDALSLIRTSADIDKTNQMLNLYFSNSQHTLTHFRLGQRLTVTMRTAAKNLSVVPAESVVLAQNQNYVWQIDELLKAHKTSVSIIKNLGRTFLVQATLTETDRVVTLGQNNLADQGEVKILNDLANTVISGEKK